MDKNLMEMAKINASGLPETICNFYSIMEQKLNELAKEKAQGLGSSCVSALLQQCDVDRELLREIGMKESPQYGFNCDVIHNLEKYIEVLTLVLTEPGWEEDHGPSQATLWKIYRQRLADPKLKAEYRNKMDVISCFRGRNAILNNPEAIENGVAFSMEIA